MAGMLAAGALACGWAEPAAGARTVTVAVLPTDSTVAELARIRDMSPGLMSAGIGRVPAAQTFLDISQGNRVADSLYDRDLPPVPRSGILAPNWGQIVSRADSAPAKLAPGLLASSLLDRGVASGAAPGLVDASLAATDRGGVVRRRQPARGLFIAPMTLAGLGRAAQGLRGDDLLIAIAKPPPGENEALPIGIAGTGFHGDLTSDSTRTGGYTLATDLAPTILRRFGVALPGEMVGEPIRAEGSIDAGAIEDLGERMKAVPERRAPVVISCLAAWILAATLVGLARTGLRENALAWLALSFAYLPLLLLAGAALEPSAAGEGLLVGFGAAGLAAITLRFRGWFGLAIACALTVGAYAIDVVAGSGLTTLSLLGPNPILGVRFYGIGNELEALIAAMVPIGVGAGLSAYTGWGRAVSRGAAAAAFLTAGLIGALLFGAGRFGADVGAAIVLPVGAAVAVASIPAGGSAALARSGVPIAAEPAPNGRRIAAVVLAAPFIALTLVALIDLISGADAHLTRSVLDAGGAADLADVAQRRLELSADDFAEAGGNPLFWVVIAGVGFCLARWRRIDAWLRPFPAARAGVIGACVAVAVGVLVNDSGATFLVLGSLALGAALAFAWAQASGTGQASGHRRQARISRAQAGIPMLTRNHSESAG